MASLAFNSFAMFKSFQSLPFTLKCCISFAVAYFSAGAVAPLVSDMPPTEFAMLVVGGPVLLVTFALVIFGVDGMFLGILL